MTKNKRQSTAFYLSCGVILIIWLLGLPFFAPLKHHIEAEIGTATSCYALQIVYNTIKDHNEDRQNLAKWEQMAIDYALIEMRKDLVSCGLAQKKTGKKESEDSKSKSDTTKAP